METELQVLQMILEAVAGPVSGIVVSLLCLVGFFYFMVKHQLPQQERIVTDLIKGGRANRKVFVDAVEVMSRRLDKVEDNVEYIKAVIVNKVINIKDID